MNDPLRIQWYSTGQEIPFDAGDLPMFTAYQVVAQVGEYDGEMVYAAEKHDFTEWGPKQWTADNKSVNLHARLTHSEIELHPIYDPENARTIQYISRS
jgi:hypothetical protein